MPMARLPHADVEINWAGEEQSSKKTASGEQLLRRVRTNRYGVAKVSGLSVPGDNVPAIFFEFSRTGQERRGRPPYRIDVVLGPGRNPRGDDKPCTNRVNRLKFNSPRRA